MSTAKVVVKGERTKKVGIYEDAGQAGLRLARRIERRFRRVQASRRSWIGGLAASKSRANMEPSEAGTLGQGREGGGAGGAGDGHAAD